jgi:uncharacterized protein (DUF433 family)
MRLYRNLYFELSHSNEVENPRGAAMSMTDWREQIVIDPAIHHGVPCIKGTRLPISVLVSSIADGDSISDLLGAYPHLTEMDVQAALKFAAEPVNHADLIPLAQSCTPIRKS